MIISLGFRKLFNATIFFLQSLILCRSIKRLLNCVYNRAVMSKFWKARQNRNERSYQGN